MTEQTIAKHLSEFTKDEKLRMCYALTHYGNLGYEIHPGLLPFIAVSTVILALMAHQHVAGFRSIAALKSKLQQLYDIGEFTSFTLRLNKAKVVKRFGSNFNRGFKIPYVTKKKVTVGVRWSLPKRDYEPDDDVLVSPHFTLRSQGNDMWQVKCDYRYFQAVSRYLLDNCV